MKTLTLVCLVLFVLGASSKDPCSKDWLRSMVINSCGMDKRHLDRKKPSAAPSLMEVLVEMDEEFDRWRLGIKSPFEEKSDPQETIMTNRIANDTGNKGEEPRAESKGFFIRLFEHPGDVLLAEMGLVASENKKMPMRRSIMMNAISKCCSDDCNEEDFEGVCD